MIKQGHDHRTVSLEGPACPANQDPTPPATPGEPAATPAPPATPPTLAAPVLPSTANPTAVPVIPEAPAQADAGADVLGAR